MRECLGWITNCPNEHSCPQNWLELAASEIPVDVQCHVCGQAVALVPTEAEMAQRAGRQELVAFPVIPCAGMNGAQRSVGNGALGHPMHTPQALESPARAPTPPRAPTPAPQRSWFCTLANGESIRVDKDTMTVGRSRTCDIVVPSAKVSRQHASLSWTGTELFIEDLGSANGVWLNGEKITRTRVSEGDVYTISDETLTFSMR
jgi:hypothetical protein